MEKWHASKTIRSIDEHSELILIFCLLLLVLAVRLYYFTGPIFANTQDEGIYFNLFANQVVSHNYLSFTQYTNANFSNVNQSIMNPSNIPSFYSGLIYPEFLILSIFGFSYSLAIYYVIFTSLIEALFLFLILKEISTRRAAVIGTILFAFFPLDVIFSNHIQPLVPAVALITAATYFFIKSRPEGKLKPKKKYPYNMITGFLIGLAYLTNPISLVLIAFIALYKLFSVIKNTGSLYDETLKISTIIVGFAIAFSLTGVYYYAQSGNFFLYPTLDHAGAVNNALTQPQGTVFKLGNLDFTRMNIEPFFYLPLIFDFSSYSQYRSSYFSIIGYLAVAFAVILLIYRVKYGKFFASMLVFYYLLLNFLPLAIIGRGQSIQVFLIYMEPMLTTFLTLPFIVIVALGLEFLFSRKKNTFKVVAYIIIIATLIVSVGNLNSDTSYYNSSVASIYEFKALIASNPTATFFAYPQTADEINVVTNYKYNVHYLIACSSSYVNSLKFQNANDTYVLTGGSISMDTEPSTASLFAECIAENLTSNFKPVFNASNPFDSQSPVRIYGTNPPYAIVPGLPS